MREVWYGDILAEAEKYVTEHEKAVLHTMHWLCDLAQCRSVDERLRIIDERREELGGVGNLVETSLIMQKEGPRFDTWDKAFCNAVMSTENGLYRYLSVICYLGMSEFSHRGTQNPLMFRKILLSAVPMEKTLELELKLELMCLGTQYEEITPEMLQCQMDARGKWYEDQETKVTEEDEEDNSTSESEEESEEAELVKDTSEKMQEYWESLDKKVYGKGIELAETFRRVSNKVSSSEWKKIIYNPSDVTYWIIYATPKTRKRILKLYSMPIQEAIWLECESFTQRENIDGSAERYLLQFFKFYNELKYGFSVLH